MADITESQLLLYQDGELSGEEERQVEAYLRENPGVAEDMAWWDKEKAVLRGVDGLGRMSNEDFIKTVDELVLEDADHRSAPSTEPQEGAGLLFFFSHLKTRITIAVISLSLTFAGGVAVSLGFIAWRTQQAVMSLQGPGLILMQRTAPVLRGSSEVDENARDRVYALRKEKRSLSEPKFQYSVEPQEYRSVRTQLEKVCEKDDTVASCRDRLSRLNRLRNLERQSERVGGTQVDETGKFSLDPVWFRDGPLIFNLEVLDVPEASKQFKHLSRPTNYKGPRYEMRLGYLADGDDVSVDRDMRLNVRISAEEFIDGQGLWCLIINSCAKEGTISAVYGDNSGKAIELLEPIKVVPGELTPLAGWPLRKRLGVDKLTIVLKVGERQFSKTVTYNIE
jgi:hypothetical protein